MYPDDFPARCPALFLLVFGWGGRPPLLSLQRHIVILSVSTELPFTSALTSVLTFCFPLSNFSSILPTHLVSKVQDAVLF